MKKRIDDKTILSTLTLIDPKALSGFDETSLELRELGQRIVAQGLGCRLAVWVRGGRVLIGIVAYSVPQNGPKPAQVLRVFRSLERGSQREGMNFEGEHQT